MGYSGTLCTTLRKRVSVEASRDPVSAVQSIFSLSFSRNCAILIRLVESRGRAMDFLNTMIELFLRYGYLVVFLGVMLENAAIPVPGETILLAAGFFAAQGQLDIVLVISVAIVGAILGDNCGDLPYALVEVFRLQCRRRDPLVYCYGLSGIFFR